MIVAIDEVIDNPGQEHDVDEGRNQGQQHLENENVWQGEQTHGRAAQESDAMFPDSLQRAEGPAESLAHQAAHVERRLGESQRAVFVVDPPAML